MSLTLLVVLAFFSMLYVHYVREPKYDSWIPISRLNALRNSVAFARFDNRNADDDNENTVDVGVRFNEESSEDKSVTDFNNPLYEREQVTMGSVETDMLQPATSSDLPETSTADISLVDISLNTTEI